MLDTPQLRRVWGPACRFRQLTVSLYGAGRITVDSRTGEAWKALSAVLAAWRYATRAADTGAFNCRRITGGTGYSLHAFGIAADLNWQSNPYSTRLITDMPAGMRTAIKAIRTNTGAQVFGWGGDYSVHHDAMHWEIVCTPFDLAQGINWKTVNSGTTEDDMLTSAQAKQLADTHTAVVTLIAEVRGLADRLDKVEDRLDADYAWSKAAAQKAGVTQSEANAAHP